MTLTRVTERVAHALDGVRGDAIDEKAGTIRGVVVCGLDSANGRRYPRQVLERDCGKYEGAKVYFNHTATGNRLVEDAGGWLTDVRPGADGRPRATHRRYRQVVEAHVLPPIGGTRLRELTRARLADWLDGLQAAGVSAGERVRAVKYLRTALKAAVARDLIPRNPAADLKPPKHVKAEKVPFTVEQAKAILAAAGPLGLFPAVRVWLDAGPRPAEMFALQWGDFDPDGGHVTVRRALDEHTGKVKTTKTDRVRRVPLSGPARTAVLTARGAPGELVMPAPRGGMWTTPNFRTRVWLPLLLAAGVAVRRGKAIDQLGLTPYAFRHTMASVALSRGVSIVALSRRLGHKKVSTTLDEYGHLMPDDAERVAAVMGEVFG